MALALAWGALAAGPAQSQPRLLWSAPLRQLGAMAAAPLEWEARQWAWVPVGLGAIGALAAVEPGLRDTMRGRTAELDALMPAASAAGEGWVLAGAAAMAWGLGAGTASGKLQEAGAVTLQALAVSAVLTVGLKLAIGSVRPSTISSEHRYFDYHQPYGALSFPSGHSTSAFAAAEAFGATYGRWWTYPLAATIAYSRVYEGAHWPADILAGAVLGILTGREAVKESRDLGPPTALWTMGLSQDGQKIALSVKF